MKDNKLIKKVVIIFMFILFCDIQAVSYNNKESVINNYYNNLSNKEFFIHANTGIISLEEYNKTLLFENNKASSFMYNAKIFMFSNVVNEKVSILDEDGSIKEKDINEDFQIKESVLIKQKVEVLGNGTKASPYIFIRSTPKEYKINLNVYDINEEIFQQFEKTVPVGGTLAFNIKNFEKGFLIKNEDLKCEEDSLIKFQNNQIIVSYASKDDTCTAKITPSISRVTLNANGGTNSSGMIYKDMIYYTAYTSNQTLPYTGNMFASGYTFKGWYTAQSGGTQVFNENGQLNASVSGYSDSSRRWLYYAQNITLYAQWQSNVVTVAFNGAPFETISWSGGSVVLDTYGKGTALIAPASYTFTSSIGKVRDKNGNLVAFTKVENISTSNITINMYPNGTVYWYGNGDKYGESLYSSVNGAATGTGGITYYGANPYPTIFTGPNQIYSPNMVQNTNDMYFKMEPHNVGHPWAQFHCSYKITNTLYRGNKTKITVRYKLVQNNPEGSLYNGKDYANSFDVTNNWPNDEYTQNGTFSVPENPNGDNLEGWVSLSNAASYFHFNLLMKGSFENDNPTDAKQYMTVYAIWMS